MRLTLVSEVITPHVTLSPLDHNSYTWALKYYNKIIIHM